MARKPKPWFRAGRGWYGTVKRKQVPLGVPDPGAVQQAREAFDRLLASVSPPDPTAPAEPPWDWRAKVNEWIAQKS